MDLSTANNVLYDLMDLIEEVNSQPLAFNAVSIRTVQSALQKLLNLVGQEHFPGSYISVHTNWRRTPGEDPQFVDIFLYGVNKKGADLKKYITDLRLQRELMKG